MRAPIGLAILALLVAAPPPAEAQYAPPGSYQRHCRDIRMEGYFLHAWCEGTRGSGQSSLNVQSCRTDIGVDPDGGLICGGPGAGAYPDQPYARPAPGYSEPGPYPRPDRRPGYPGQGGYYPPQDSYYPPQGGYYPPQGGYGRPQGGYYPPGRGGESWGVTLFERPGYRGRSIEVGYMDNLDGSGFNDRVGSIRLSRGSGPWQVCTDARFRGRCTTIDRSISDTSQLGMWAAISSVRPVR